MIKGLEKCQTTYEENLAFFKSQIEALPDTLSKRKHQNPLSHIGGDFSLTGEYYFYCTEDVKETSKYFYKAGLKAILLWDIALGRTNLSVMLKNPPTLTHSFWAISNLSFTLFPEVLKGYFERVTALNGQEFPHEVMYALSNTCKYYVLDDITSAKEWLQITHQRTKTKTTQDIIGHIKAIEGMLTNKIDLINEGIEVIIKAYRRKEVDPIRDVVCLDATGLAKFALDRGFEVDTKHPLIYKGFLEPIEFKREDIWEIKQALGIE
jgi:hypothetical protein